MDQMISLAGSITTIAAAAAMVVKLLQKINCIVEGLRCQLRTDMLRVYYRHREEKEIRQYEMENFEHNYNAYVALNGNSFIEEVHNEVKTWKIIS